MAVTLDAPAQHPTWRVQCDRDDCHSRLYVQAPTANVAVERAADEYGWDCRWDHRLDDHRLTCPCVHEESS